MVLFPPGEVLLWYYFPLGKFCYGISSGEGFSYGIISVGTICHGISSLIMKFVWVGGGGIYHRWGKLYHMVLFPPWGSSAMGFIPGEGLPYGIPMVYPFHTIIINHISQEICLHVSLPINLHIISACK